MRRQVLDLDPSLQAVITTDDDDAWSVQVTATVNLRCVFGEEHTIDIITNRHIGHHTDELLLTAFEWAIRGRRDSILRLTMAIIDDEIDQHFIDPCLENER